MSAEECAPCVGAAMRTPALIAYVAGVGALAYVAGFEGDADAAPLVWILTYAAWALGGLLAGAWADGCSLLLTVVGVTLGAVVSTVQGDYDNELRVFNWLVLTLVCWGLNGLGVGTARLARTVRRRR